MELFCPKHWVKRNGFKGLNKKFLNLVYYEREGWGGGIPRGGGR